MPSPDPAPVENRAEAAVVRQRASHGHHNTLQSFTDVPSQVVTVGLASVAVAIHAIVVADGEYGIWFYSWLLIKLLSMPLLAWGFRRIVKRFNRELIVSPILVLMGLSAIILEFCSRSFWGIGNPFEIMTMTVVRNLVWGLAVVSVFPIHQRLAVSLSLFLVMFGFTMSNEVSLQWLAGVFAIGAVVWLVVSHWENVRRRLEGRERTAWPRWAFATPLVLILILGLGAATADRSVTRALRGFLPSSGGIGDSDPYARDGVGDGEMLVAGTERIQSFAPIEDAPFMQDDKPSLYDLFDDTYEDEAEIAKNDRAISLPTELANRAQEHLHHRTEKANREFSTLREVRDPSRNRHVSDIRSRALFYVAGRVPLHLKLEVYDLYDGVKWYPQEKPSWQQPLELKTSSGEPWVILNDRGDAREYLAPAETHAIKNVGLETNVIPAPNYLHGVHIDLVDRLDMFRHGPDGLVALERKSLPTLVPIHLASRSINWEKLPDVSNLFLPSFLEDATKVIPGHLDIERLRRQAKEWHGNEQNDWQRISSIVENLRADYVVDADWRPEPNSEDGVEQFLFESKRGPDYQFATASAMLLRSIGYATRVVSGFYVDPASYDSQSRHTPVYKDDVHFWTEVRVSGGDWITIEATPGYEVLGPPPGFFDRLWEGFTAIIQFCLQNWLLFMTLFLSASLLWWQRQRVSDLFHSARWQLILYWKPEFTLPATLRLLRQRAHLSGIETPRSITHHHWLGRLLIATDVQEHARMLYELRKEIDIAAYSRREVQISMRVSSLCRDVVSTCTLNWFGNLPVDWLQPSTFSSSQRHQQVEESTHTHVEHIGK